MKVEFRLKGLERIENNERMQPDKFFLEDIAGTFFLFLLMLSMTLPGWAPQTYFTFIKQSETTTFA